MNLRRFLLASAAAATLALLPVACATHKADKIEPVGTKQITRELLLKDDPIPERREIPISTKTPACQDFHAYVCEQVESQFKLPADRSHWTFSFTDSIERLLYAKKRYFKLLTEGYTPRTGRALPLKNYYLACMNEPAQAAEEKEKVAAEKNYWLNASREDIKAQLLPRLYSGDYTPFIIDVNADQSDPTKPDALIMLSIMTLPEKNDYKKPEDTKDLKNLAVALFKAIGASEPEARAQQVVDFETAFANVYLTPAEFRSRYSTNTYIPRDQWQKKYPGLAWDKFLEPVPKTVRIRDFTSAALNYTHQALDKDDLAKLQNTFLFHSLVGVLDDAYPEYYKEYFAFQHKHFGGPEKRPARDERCTKAVMYGFGMDLDQELIDILFPGFPEDKAVNTAERVRAAILKQIESNKWLSPQARKGAHDKIAKAQLSLVKPHREEDWAFLPAKPYSDKTPLANRKLHKQAEVEFSLNDARMSERNRSRWYYSPLAVNAYYTAEDNRFVLMQGILQFPFFDGSQSDVENLGAIGAVIGHEMGHGIDDQGSKYDSTGKLRQWMNAHDLKEFAKRTGQFVDRFNKVGHNGKLTLGENIGDHVGITTAFMAAFPEPDKASTEDMQKFFRAYGRTWCEVVLPEARAVQLKTNPHSMGDQRINQQVINVPAFAKAFACKPGDAMYLAPKDQIRVW